LGLLASVVAPGDTLRHPAQLCRKMEILGFIGYQNNTLFFSVVKGLRKDSVPLTTETSVLCGD